MGFVIPFLRKGVRDLPLPRCVHSPEIRPLGLTNVCKSTNYLFGYDSSNCIE